MIVSQEKIKEFIKEQHAIDGMVSIHDFELWLEEQPRVGEWIPCSERLPEESGKYLGQLLWGNITDITFSKKHQKWNAHDSAPPEHAMEVVAWMPLPEPYKLDQTAIRCNPSACEHRRYSSGYHVIDKLNHYMTKHKLTIRGMAGEKLIITDQATGEEYVVEDLGYPF